MIRIFLLLCCINTFCETSLPAAFPDTIGVSKTNLFQNPDFGNGMEGWNSVWAREADAAKAVFDTTEHHNAALSLRIEFTGKKDWSLTHSLDLKVETGEIYELSAWVRVQGSGSVTLSVITRDAAGKTIDWTYGGRSAREIKGWRLLRSRFVVSSGTATVTPRLTGYGPAIVWCSEFSLVRQGSLQGLQTQGLPATLIIHNAAIEATLSTADATFSVKDRRIDRTWIQRAGGAQMVVIDARVDGNAMNLKMLDPLSMHGMVATARLDGEAPELVVTLHGEGEMDSHLAWPSPFASAKGEMLILPVNEGISYPVDDDSLPPMHYILYAGHGLCMPWYGTVDNGKGWMVIVETPDDASVDISRRDGLLCILPEWEPQKQHFGSDRVIRYIFSNGGGYVAMAKRYREYAKKTGLFKTLEEKRKTLPAVDLLVGAVNIWCWDPAAVTWCSELQALGIRRILWSNALPPDQIKALNSMGVLTSRYDIYQDAMNPENLPLVRWPSPDWTTDAWKKHDLVIGEDGEWVRGWEVKTKDGKMIPCGTLCDREAVAYAEQRIPADLSEHPYRCRFIDTTTASAWRECYDPNHPMTRTDSKQYKMKLLRYVSEGCGLICGSETGHDAAVPFVHYFEGMLSLTPYRIPDAGRETKKIWNDVPEKVAKFQTGHVYRLPLWELVYHDCVVAQWYWGDYNNKLPKLWDRRDLWNALYGTPPMFMFDREIWKANKDRFVKSYQRASTMARSTGYSEMLSHEWLTADHSVQQTRFANGVTVTVNFGDAPWSPPAGSLLPSLGLRIEGMKQQ